MMMILSFLRLASRCLHYEPQERPNTRSLITTLTLLQKETEVPSHSLMGIPHNASSVPLCALGEACVRRNLTAILELLESIGYKDDEGVTNEMWTDQMQQSLESKKKGDNNFKQKDFKSAIERYTQEDTPGSKSQEDEDEIGKLEEQVTDLRMDLANKNKHLEHLIDQFQNLIVDISTWQSPYSIAR